MPLLENPKFTFFLLLHIIVDTKKGGSPETQINCLINDGGALACTTTLAIHQNTTPLLVIILISSTLNCL